MKLFLHAHPIQSSWFEPFSSLCSIPNVVETNRLLSDNIFSTILLFPQAVKQYIAMSLIQNKVRDVHENVPLLQRGTKSDDRRHSDRKEKDQRQIERNHSPKMFLRWSQKEPYIIY
jgi:hypothetical protein